MKNTLKLMSAMLLAFAFSMVHAQSNNELTPEENEYIEALTPLAEIAQEQGFKVRVAVVATKSSHLSRVFMTYKDGQCVFGINVRKNTAGLDPLSVKGGFDRKLMLRAVLAHEMGHCYHAALSARELSADAFSIASAQEDKHEGELRADLFALAWTAVYHPEDFSQTMAYFKAIRNLGTQQGFSVYPEPEELTRAWAYRAKEGNANPDILVSLASKSLD